jgi:hypothetical protein
MNHCAGEDQMDSHSVSQSVSQSVSKWDSELARGLLGFCRCELLLWEAGSWGQGHFGNPGERERPSLEAVKSNDTEDVTVATSVGV